MKVYTVYTAKPKHYLMKNKKVKQNFQSFLYFTSIVWALYQSQYQSLIQITFFHPRTNGPFDPFTIYTTVW